MTRSRVVGTAVLLLVLFGVMASPGYSADGLRVGVRAGWPWSWISYDDPRGPQETDTDTRIFSGGMVLELPLWGSDRLSLVSGVTYVVRSGAPLGIEMENQPGDITGTRTSDWTYYCIAAPLLVKYSFTTVHLAPYVACGAEVGIPLKGEQSSDFAPADGGPITGDIRDVTDDMRVVEFSLAAVGGLEFPVGSRVGFVELVYVHGLTDVWRDDLEEVRYRTLTVMGGVMF